MQLKSAVSERDRTQIGGIAALQTRRPVRGYRPAMQHQMIAVAAQYSAVRNDRHLSARLPAPLLQIDGPVVAVLVEKVVDQRLERRCSLLEETQVREMAEFTLETPQLLVIRIIYLPECGNRLAPFEFGSGYQ